MPSGWVRECPGEQFCFSRPADLKLQPVQVIDSLAGVYRSETLTLRFDLGRYGTSSRHLANPAEEAVTIDDRPARMLVTEREIMLLVPKVHPSGPFTIQFGMQLQSSQTASRDLALRIFKTIEFRPPR